MSKKAEAVTVVTGTTISFSADGGTGGRAQILDSGNGLGDFVKRKKITVAGAGTAANNASFEILSVAPGIIEVAAGTIVTEAAGTSIVLVSAEGGSMSDLFRNSVLDIYSGVQPTDADQGETGTKLVSITLSSGAFTDGLADSGINFDEAVAGVLSKDDDEVWSGSGLANGTAGWFRLYDNDHMTGISTTGVRLDGSIATSGAQMNLSNTAITAGGTTTVDSVNLTMPAS